MHSAKFLASAGRQSPRRNSGKSLPQGTKRQDYISEEQHYTSPDGTAIPVQLLRRRDAKPQQPLPTLLYGYGAYGIPESGHFSITRLALVDLGWQHAAARIRGGDDLGRHWYREGKLAQKEKQLPRLHRCCPWLNRRATDNTAGFGNTRRLGGAACWSEPC